MSAPYWVDIIEDVVDLVRADDDLPSGLSTGAPYYMHGHPLEIINTLMEKDRQDTYKYRKYPIIALFQDFTEEMGEDQRIQSRASLNIVIATDTSSDYKSADRYDNTFRTVLYPIYDLFIKHIVEIAWFVDITHGLVPHRKIDRLYWGATGLYGTEANLFNDRIDAIEIQDMDLSLRLNQKCYTNG